MNTTDVPGWYQRLTSLFSKQSIPANFKNFCAEHEPRLKILYPFLTQEQIKGRLLQRWKKINLSGKHCSGDKKRRTWQKYPVARVIRDCRSIPSSPKQKILNGAHKGLPVEISNQEVTIERDDWANDDNRTSNLSQEGKTYKGRSFSLRCKVPEIISQATPNTEKSILKSGKVTAASDRDMKRNIARVSFSWNDDLETKSPDLTSYKHNAAPSPDKALSFISNATPSPSTTQPPKSIITRPRRFTYSNSGRKTSHKKEKHRPKVVGNPSLKLKPVKVGGPVIQSVAHEAKRFCLFEDEWFPPEKSKQRKSPKKTTKAFRSKAESRKAQRKRDAELSLERHRQPSRKTIVYSTLSTETDKEHNSFNDKKEQTKLLPKKQETKVLKSQRTASCRKSQRTKPTYREENACLLTRPCADRGFENCHRRSPRFQNTFEETVREPKTKRNLPQTQKRPSPNFKSAPSLSKERNCRKRFKAQTANDKSQIEESNSKIRNKTHSDSLTMSLETSQPSSKKATFSHHKGKKSDCHLTENPAEKPVFHFENKVSLAVNKQSHLKSKKSDVWKEAASPIALKQNDPKCDGQLEDSSAHTACASDDDIPQQMTEATNVLLRIIMQLKSTATYSQDIGKSISSLEQSKATEITETSFAPSSSIPELQMSYEEPRHGGEFPSNRTMAQVHKPSTCDAGENILCDLFEDPDFRSVPSLKKKRNIPSKMEHSFGALYSPSDFI